jgi:DNA-binding transcriptional LysR family regulator
MYKIEHMITTHIDRVDLNLIPALIALLEERQVSRAAARIRLTQPAMSRALQRLRQALDDPLLIRETGGYRLTEHAQSIYAQLTSIVPQLEMLLSPSQFDPRSSTRPVSLAGTDYAAYTYAPTICRKIMADAPLTPVRFHAWRYRRVAEQILRGGVDLGLYGGSTPEELSSAELLVEQFVCVVADTHPLATSKAITLADYRHFDHIIVDVEDGRQPDIDYKLDKLNSPRKPTITVPYHAVVPALLPGTDLLATLPSRFITAWPETESLRILPAPPEIATMPYRMIWHPALDSDKWHQWLRAIVRSAVNQSHKDAG